MKSGGTSRKGLRRRGMNAYEVRGPDCTMVIERERPWRFTVYPEGWPRDPHGVFFCLKFSRLYLARAHAESQAGLA